MQNELWHAAQHGYNLGWWRDGFVLHKKSEKQQTRPPTAHWPGLCQRGPPWVLTKGTFTAQGASDLGALSPGWGRYQNKKRPRGTVQIETHHTPHATHERKANLLGTGVHSLRFTPLSANLQFSPSAKPSLTFSREKINPQKLRKTSFHPQDKLLSKTTGGPQCGKSPPPGEPPKSGHLKAFPILALRGRTQTQTSDPIRLVGSGHTCSSHPCGGPWVSLPPPRRSEILRCRGFQKDPGGSRPKTMGKGGRKMAFLGGFGAFTS